MFLRHPAHNAEKGSFGLVLLGPLFGLLYLVLLPVIGLMTVILALPELASAKKAAPERTTMCMTCHSSKGLSKIFRNNERRSVYVNAAEISGSAHAGLSCNDCHQKITMASHPGREFASSADFSRDAAQACRLCHSRDQLAIKPHHASVVNGPNAPPCTECHDSHAVKQTAVWKKSFSGNGYCMVCHQKKISKTHTNGENLSLMIDPANLASSVHAQHRCSDCHTDYSSASHPVKKFASSRDHSIAVSGVCRNCHADKHTAVIESIHYRMMSEGNTQAPVCTDCHGFHKVGQSETYATLSGTPCRKCHEEVFKAYSSSVHGAAQARGEHRAPLCSSCHFAHEVQSAALSEKIKNACLGCHREAEQLHRQWLPNADLHLSVVACAACHSPKAGKGIFLKLYDETTGQPFTDEQVAGILGTSRADLTRRLGAHGEGLDSAELWAIVRELNAKGTNARVTFLGRMDVSNGREAHNLSMKKEAVRECESCHSQQSAHFTSVTVAVVKADGRLDKYKAKPEVLGSIFSFVPLREFYVLGSTRLKILDWIGIAMVLGGMSVPAAHIALRIITAPIREAKRLNRMRREGRR